MKRKKIQYVFLESGAFLSDPIFQAMTAEQKGVYCTLFFHLYENGGRFPLDTELLKKLCNCSDFSNVWEFIKQKFKVKSGIISHKRVTRELRKARQKSKTLVAAGLKGAEKRWLGHNHPMANRSENESKRIEDKRSNSNTNGSPFQSLISSIRLDLLEAGQLETLRFRIYDILGGIFTGRTISDSTSLRNLTKWVKEQIEAGKFQPEVFKRIVNIAVESKNGKSRKPIAVFFAQVKSELGYKKEE